MRIIRALMAEANADDLMERIVSLCKRRGLIWQSSEAYGGINGFWDYGPLGAELKRNIKDYWWRCMTQGRTDIVGLDASIIMHPRVWEASGHTATFSDPMVDCLLTKKRFRADQIEPQSGTVYHFSGMLEGPAIASVVDELKMDEATYGPALRLEQDTLGMARRLREDPNSEKRAMGERFFARLEAIQIPAPFSVLVSGDGGEAKAIKVAQRYYQQSKKASLPHPCLERIEAVQNSVRFNPENGAQLTEPRQFNLMFKTYVGPVESTDHTAFLRPETAQAIFVQFKNVLESSRQKVPFGICQIGKAFRNEINPRNFTFRSREFEQMEVEFFIRPDAVVEKLAGSVAAGDSPGDTPEPNWGWKAWHRYWVDQRVRWYESIGLPRQNLHLREQGPEELAHYAQATTDIEFDFPFGRQELEGIAARGDFDLKQHEEFSGKSMEYFDEAAKLKYLPHVIEPSAGVDRLLLALICNAYAEEEITDEKGKQDIRTILKFHPRIAPYKVGVFPLLKNRPQLVAKAKEVRDLLMPSMTVFYDESGAIGRRYRRQDEIGTPFGVTIDFDTLGEDPKLKDTVTLRDRDSMQQERLPIDQLIATLTARIR